MYLIGYFDEYNITLNYVTGFIIVKIVYSIPYYITYAVFTVHKKVPSFVFAF